MMDLLAIKKQLASQYAKKLYSEGVIVLIEGKRFYYVNGIDSSAPETRGNRIKEITFLKLVSEGEANDDSK